MAEEENPDKVLKGEVKVKNKPKPKKKPKSGKAPVLSIVPTTPPKDPPPIMPIDPNSVKNLDIDQLREHMASGIYTLEAALFTQAGFEYQRIEKLRGLVNVVEADLFDKTKFDKLTQEQKARLYGLMLHNMSSSLTFLQNLHGNVTSGIEALAHIEKLKSQRGVPTQSNVDEQKVAQVKQLILDKIKSKTDKK